MVAEIEALPPADFPIMMRLRPLFTTTEPGETYVASVEMLLDGIEAMAKRG